ncbi:MAG TPA: hypothetical protein VKZ53_18805 [Candidatus Angelobacter sp.]|nr:hypothetical protein [Candidatus Angelobacter sp.]
MKTANSISMLLALLVIGYSGSALSQQPAAQAQGVPVSTIVSVEAKHGKEVPTIYKEDVRVLHGHDRLPVVEWTPCLGDRIGTELFLLVDEANSTELGLQLGDLGKFINSQTDGTAVAVGYIRDGIVDVRQNFTKDHALAAKALRLPFGSAGALGSPYTAITDLVHRWPQTANCREILLLSSGIDALQPGFTNSYLDEAIDALQRAGIQAYSIYTSHAGHVGHTFWRFNVGQNNLSRLTDETGGEAYFQGLEMPISFGPYLNTYGERLKHQFLLTFKIEPEKKPGFQKIRVETEVANAELVAAERVYVAEQK